MVGVVFLRSKDRMQRKIRADSNPQHLRELLRHKVCHFIAPNYIRTTDRVQRIALLGIC
jgi:hypothetical protein